MGRKLKRVPLDFKWPIDKTWEGYLNPFWKKASKCIDCEGQGLCPEGVFLHNTWYRHTAKEMFGAFGGDSIHSVRSAEAYRRMGWSDTVIKNIEMAVRFGFETLTHWSDKLHQDEVKALVEAGRLSDLTQDWNPETRKWEPKNPPVMPTPADVARWNAKGLGHDAINCSVACRARAKRFGIDADNKSVWYCKVCNGDGQVWPSKEIKEKYETWKESEPPTGEGYQLWEDTSEGSPITPVFKTIDGLCEYAAEHCTTFGRSTATKEEWKKMLAENFVRHEETMPDGSRHAFM